MSWGTSFDANIYIYKMHFYFKQDVENRLKQIYSITKPIEIL